MVRLGTALLSAAMLILPMACSSPRDYFLEAPGAAEDGLPELFGLLDGGGLGDDERFAVVQKISSRFIEREDYGRLITFLTGVVDADPAGRYDARYLLSVAWAYSRRGADDVALLYYDRIVKNYADLVVNGESIHFACLRRILALSPSPSRRIEYRRELIARFPDRVDLGTELFLLGLEFEEMGDWDAALDAYKRFLSSYVADVPGHPDALQYARSFIDLATIPKDWTFETLDELLSAVKRHMASGNSRALSRIRAKVGFFAMDWHQDRDDGNSQVLFDLGVFMAGGRVYYADALDPSSSSREAFLRTWGWTERIATWYLYFRKINFPADPEVHGRWEWAGIYFGEKIQ